MSWLSDIGRWFARATYDVIKYSPIGGIIYAIQYGIVNGVIPSLESAGMWGQKEEDGRRSLPGLRGATNKLNKNGKVPLVVGTHYLAPPLAGKQYTEISSAGDGADQYLHVSYILGYGPAAVRNIKIGDNLLASNSSGAMGAVTVDGQAFISGGSPVVEAELRYDSTAMTYYPSRISEDQLGGGQQMRSPAGTPTELYRMTAPGCTGIAIDIEFPNGLNKEGNKSASVNFKAEYIDPATETWASAHSITNTTLTKALKQTARYTYSVSGLTAKTYQVRVYRVTADATDSTIADTCYWTALRSTIGTQAPVKASLAAKVVRLSMRVKASDNVNGSIGNVSAEVSPKIPIYSGSGTGRAQWTTVAETSNPAAIALYLLRGDATGDGVGVGPNPSPRVDANIDYPAFEALYQWCETRNTAGKPNWCNGVFDGEATTRDMLTKVLSTCRAQLIKRGNIVSVVQDSERTTPVALITPRNSDNYQGSKQFPDLPHGYRVSFINADAGWQPDVRIVLADGYLYDTDNDGNLRDAWGTIRAVGGGYALATKLESIERWGLTDPDEVFREARATLAAITLRPEVHTVTQDWQALGYQYGDLVRFGHDVPEFGLIGGRVKSVTVDGSGNATSIVTDEIVTMEVGKSYSICYQRASDGRVLFAAINTVVGSNYSATFTTPVPAADIPAANDVYHYGEGSYGGTVPMIIVGLESGGDNSTTVHMQDYGAGIFSADAGTIPAFVSNISAPVAQDFAGALKLRQVAATAAQQVVQATTQAVATSTEKANAIIAAMAPTASPSAAYRGSAPYASPPGSPAANNTCVLYSTTAAECGIYMYSGSAWVRQTSPTDVMLVDAWGDILIAVNVGYCAYTDYVGTGITVADVLAVSSAFIVKMWAKEITLNPSGYLKSYDYAETDNMPDAGFMLDVANQAISAYGAKFRNAAIDNASITNASFSGVLNINELSTTQQLNNTFTASGTYYGQAIVNALQLTILPWTTTIWIAASGTYNSKTVSFVRYRVNPDRSLGSSDYIEVKFSDTTVLSMMVATQYLYSGSITVVQAGSVALNAAQLPTKTGDYSVSLAAGASQVLPRGIYMSLFDGTSNLETQGYYSGTWLNGFGGSATRGQLIFADGANVRIVNTGGATTAFKFIVF